MGLVRVQGTATSQSLVIARRLRRRVGGRGSWGTASDPKQGAQPLASPSRTGFIIIAFFSE